MANGLDGSLRLNPKAGLTQFAFYCEIKQTAEHAQLLHNKHVQFVSFRWKLGMFRLRWKVGNLNYGGISRSVDVLQWKVVML